jgi:hypothetical protein
MYHSIFYYRNRASKSDVKKGWPLESGVGHVVSCALYIAVTFASCLSPPQPRCPCLKLPFSTKLRLSDCINLCHVVDGQFGYLTTRAARPICRTAQVITRPSLHNPQPKTRTKPVCSQATCTLRTPPLRRLQYFSNHWIAARLLNVRRRSPIHAPNLHPKPLLYSHPKP